MQDALHVHVVLARLHLIGLSQATVLIDDVGIAQENGARQSTLTTGGKTTKTLTAVDHRRSLSESECHFLLVLSSLRALYGERFSIMLDPRNLEPFVSLSGKVIKNLFGKGRTFSRGRKFAAEGYLHAVEVRVCDGDAVITAKCWASQTKDKEHKIFLAIGTSGKYDPFEERCSCTAGQGRCAHKCAIYHFLSAGGAYVRSLRGDKGRRGQSQPNDADVEPQLSCTSRPRQWGIPSRRVEPYNPVEEIKFQKSDILQQ